MDRNPDDYDVSRRPRRFDEEYDDDLDYRRLPERSGWVLGVAVVNFLLGSLLLMVALFCLFAGFMMGVGGNRRERDEAIIPILIGFFGLLLGVGYLVSGLGLLGRRNWARILTLVLGAFNFLAVGGGLLGMVGILANSRGLRGDAVAALVFSCFGTVLNLGYGLLVYLTLLRSSIAREFSHVEDFDYGRGSR